MSQITRAPRYVGFWMRVVAGVIDIVILLLIAGLLLYWAYGSSYFTSLLDAQLAALSGAPTAAAAPRPMFVGPADVLINVVLPVLLFLVFWRFGGATPGKMLISAKIVDAKTLGDPAAWQLLVRFLVLAVSAIPLGIVLIWVAFDRRKQGLHDKLARTVVIYAKND
ncbi:MAG: RDD family protein [Betaproteobacteria bacterium]|nr:RDD family protein [Betaproteobacteria bacterium]